MKAFAGNNPDKLQQFIQDWETKAAKAPKAKKGDPNAERPIYKPESKSDKELAISEVSKYLMLIEV